MTVLRCVLIGFTIAAFSMMLEFVVFPAVIDGYHEPYFESAGLAIRSFIIRGAAGSLIWFIFCKCSR
jgi:hypothetical protein